MKKLLLLLMLSVFLSACGSSDKAPKEETQTTEGIKEEEFDFSTAEVTSDNVIKAIEPVFVGVKDIQAEVDEENNVTISYLLSSIISEKQAVKSTTEDYVEIAKVMYSNPNTNEVWITTNAETIDSKGAEQVSEIIGANFSKASVEGANYDNMIDLVRQDPLKIQGIAEGFRLQPFLQEEIQE